MRLFCFPHAGGGASVYRHWPAALGEQIEVVAVRLPGRENRFGEPRYRRMAPVATDLRAVLWPWLGLPYAFFGHSLGALIAFETARRLTASGAAGPVHVFAAACRSPWATPAGPDLHTLPTGALIERLRGYGGLPTEDLADPDLLRVTLPTIRDDFEIGETYRPGA